MSFSFSVDKVELDYKSLLEEVEQIRNQDVGLEAVQNISRVMDVAEQLVENVTKPREIGLDARVLEISSAVIQQNAEKFDSVFRPEEFADKLLNFLSSGDSESSQSDSSIWKKFTENFGHILPLCPRFDYLLGTFDREGFIPKQRAPRQSQSSKDLGKEMVQALPEKMGTSEESQVGQQQILDYISKLLVKAYRQNNEKPISYFQFVLNPHSFEETCQNILHVSFLVRDSFVKMFTDDIELLMVPIKPKKDDMGGLQKEEAKRQFVIQMDYDDWKELVDAYEVVEPMIQIKRLVPQKTGKKP